MSVITIINVANKIYRITKGFTKRTTTGQQYDRIVTQFPPNYRPYVRDVLRGADVAFSGGLIVEALDLLGNGLSPSVQPPSNQIRQTRSDLVKSRTGRFRYSKYTPKYCRPKRRQKY